MVMSINTVFSHYYRGKYVAWVKVPSHKESIILLFKNCGQHFQHTKPRQGMVNHYTSRVQFLKARLS